MGMPQISPGWGEWILRRFFKAELSNGEGFSTGLLLPASPYAVLDALEKLRLDKGEPPHWEITDKAQLKSLARYLDLNGSFFELNALCRQLALLDDRQFAIVEGLAKLEQTSPVPMPRFIDMAFSTDRCHLVEEAVNDHTLGRFCAENSFVPEVDGLSDDAFELLDFARIGREFRLNEGGVFTSGGYVQRHDELRQVYGTLELTPRKPGYAILVETASGCEVRLPVPPGGPTGDESVRCLDCAAPALTGLSGRLDTWDVLARRLAELEAEGELPKYKALVEAVGCDEICWALSLADELDQYVLNPNCRTPEEVAQSAISFAVPHCELELLLPCVNLYQYGRAVIQAGGGKLTGYGLIDRFDGEPVQGLNQEPGHDGMEMM